MKRRVRSHPWTTQNSLPPPTKNRSTVPVLGPYASRIARRSHARVKQRPLQSAVGTHTHYVHALARCVLYDDCCVNFGSQTICTTPSARCCDKDFLSNTDIGQPTAGLFEVGLGISERAQRRGMCACRSTAVDGLICIVFICLYEITITRI